MSNTGRRKRIGKMRERRNGRWIDSGYSWALFFAGAGWDDVLARQGRREKVILINHGYLQKISSWCPLLPQTVVLSDPTSFLHLTSRLSWFYNLMTSDRYMRSCTAPDTGVACVSWEIQAIRPCERGHRPEFQLDSTQRALHRQAILSHSCFCFTTLARRGAGEPQIFRSDKFALLK